MQEVLNGNLRLAIEQLRNIINSPIKPYEAHSEMSTAASEVDRSSGGSAADGKHAGSGRRPSDSDSPCDTDLPGLITRVLQKRKSFSTRSPSAL